MVTDNPQFETVMDNGDIVEVHAMLFGKFRINLISRIDGESIDDCW